MPSIANATPQSRAKELPDEFKVHNGQLFCLWCQKVLYSLRKDNIHEHLYSRIHQENRRTQGAAMSYDPDCPERMKRKAARKLAQRKRKEEKLKQQEMLVAESRGFGNEFDSATSSSMYGNNEETSESFEKTFATSSDSDSFEGFDSRYSYPHSVALQKGSTPAISLRAPRKNYNKRGKASSKAMSQNYNNQGYSSDEFEFSNYQTGADGTMNANTSSHFNEASRGENNAVVSASSKLI